MPQLKWEAGDTPDVPQAWRVEGLPTYYDAYWDELNRYYGDLRLKVTLKDQSVFTLGIAYYDDIQREGMKTLIQYYGYQSAESYALSQMYIRLGFLETPDVYLNGWDFLDPIRLSEYGPVKESSFWEESGTYYLPGDDSGHPYTHYLSKSLFMGYSGPERASYYNASGFFCSLVFWPGGSVGDCEGGSEAQYDSLPTPPPPPLTISGVFNRIYSQDESDALTQRGIPVEDYSLTLN
jgi:hypothetical protein